MSLVNDMLRDLDARRTAQDPGEGSVPAGLGRPARRPWGYLLGAFALVIVVLLAIAFVWQRLHQPPQAAPVGEPDLLAEPPAVQVQSSVMASASSSEAAADERNSEVQQWLIKARAAVVADQLVSPADDSAYFYYQQALRLDADNTQAHAGLRTLAERLLQRAETRLNNDDIIGAQKSLNRADALAIAPERVAAMRKRVDSKGRAEQSERAREPEQEPAATEAREVQQIDSGPSDAEQEQRVRASKNSGQPESSGDDSVQPTQALRDTRHLEQARDSVRAGNRSQAVSLLKAFLQEQAASSVWPPHSRRYLQDLYLQSGELAAARALVVDDLPAPQRAYLKARLAEHGGDDVAALQWLLGASPAVDDERYRAMLASVYQRLERWPEAQAHYRRLLEVFGPRARYWLGLAVALDRQGQYRGAANGYRQAAAAGDASAAIREFATRRLAQLNQ